MANHKKNILLSQHDWQDLYYDGETEYFDERDVSSYMKQGLNDCIEYIEDETDNDILWYKNEAQKKHYRKPHSTSDCPNA